MNTSKDLAAARYIWVILRASRKLVKIIARRSLDAMGLISAATMFGLWITTFVMICRIDLASIPLWFGALIILGRTFLHTGLFIISHDASHGTVFTPSRRINDLIGAIALTVYGLLPYKKFLINHSLHHQYPATAQDQDFYDGNVSILGW